MKSVAREVGARLGREDVVMMPQFSFTGELPLLQVTNHSETFDVFKLFQEMYRSGKDNIFQVE